LALNKPPLLPYWEADKTGAPSDVKSIRGPVTIVASGTYELYSQSLALRTTSAFTSSSRTAYHSTTQDYTVEVGGSSNHLAAGTSTSVASARVEQYGSFDHQTIGKYSMKALGGLELTSATSFSLASGGSANLTASTNFSVLAGNSDLLATDAIKLQAMMGNVRLTTSGGVIFLGGTLSATHPTIMGDLRALADTAFAEALIAAASAFTITPTALGPMPGSALHHLPPTLATWLSSSASALSPYVLASQYPTL
jgi:hypothetical protein